jgi:hypothetical protein
LGHIEILSEKNKQNLLHKGNSIRTMICRNYMLNLNPTGGDSKYILTRPSHFCLTPPLPPPAAPLIHPLTPTPRRKSGYGLLTMALKELELEQHGPAASSNADYSFAGKK